MAEMNAVVCYIDGSLRAILNLISSLEYALNYPTRRSGPLIHAKCPLVVRKNVLYMGFAETHRI